MEPHQGKSPIWKRDRVVNVRVKGDRTALAQMLEDPYLAFFLPNDDPELHESDLVFVCAVTRQFLKASVAGIATIQPVHELTVPRLRIGAHPGSREIVAWPGSARERTFFHLSERAGGWLLDRPPGKAHIGERIRELGPGDHDSVAGVELDVVWTFPLLNERLALSLEGGSPVDPLKEIQFDQPLDTKYQTFVDMLACHGTLADWGYQQA